MLEKHAVTKIVKFWDNDVATVKKISIAKREIPANKEKIDKVREMLDTTMPFWTQDAPDKMKGPFAKEDLAFFNSMQTDRVATCDRTNVKLQKSQEKQNMTKEKRDAYYDDLRKKDAASTEIVELIDDDEDAEMTGGDTEHQDQSATPSSSATPKSTRKRSAEIKLTLDQNFFNHPALVSIALRAGFTSSHLYSYLATLLQVCYLFVFFRNITYSLLYLLCLI